MESKRTDCYNCGKQLSLSTFKPRRFCDNKCRMQFSRKRTKVNAQENAQEVNAQENAQVVSEQVSEQDEIQLKRQIEELETQMKRLKRIEIPKEVIDITLQKLDIMCFDDKISRAKFVDQVIDKEWKYRLTRDYRQNSNKLRFPRKD